MYDMINIFEVFLPQLLTYPNPTDPLNGEAAALMMREPRAYEAKVQGTCFLLRAFLRVILRDLLLEIRDAFGQYPFLRLTPCD
jgi:hypothetical protein